MKTNDNFNFKFYELEKNLSDKPFLRQPFGDNWEEYTWEQTGQMARKLATGLKSLGLKENAHIGLISKNCREWVISDLAIIMAGYISVPFFATLTGKELGNLLDFGDVDALFVGKIEHWDEIKSFIPKEMPIISFPAYNEHSFVDRGYSWDDFINSHQALETPHVPKMSDTWTIIFTSGTTGTPKGVVLSYRANNGTKVISENTNPLKIDHNGNNHFFSYLPMNHIAERIVVEYTAFNYGGTISFVESIDTFGDNLNSVQPTVFFAVPRIWTKFQTGILSKFSQKKLNTLLSIPLVSSIIKKALIKKLGLSRARAKVSGAAPMLTSQREWYRKIGINIINGYGMTENCAISNQLADDIWDRPGSVGIPQEGVSIKINPKNGEILMKGIFLMEGYYKDPKTTNETLINGWLHTGDQGHVDNDGFLYITGRVKDLFKTSKGKYIEPLLLEDYFGKYSEFEQICIAGLGNPQPILLVVLSDVGKSIDKDEFENKFKEDLKKINSGLEGYKKISTIIVVKDSWTVDNGLVTPTLKVKRPMIDKKYGEHYLKWDENPSSVIWE
ncbi:MAG: AMP-dependent synthetase [Flavobacteriaceae bacterium]|nr:AMP-dependent synthetase [Flavobacteriaceae bacterium]|tara:strand:+ start:30175 stop:31848 length:1674 start_codon:yes stop_codon:yes gene_type:complete